MKIISELFTDIFNVIHNFFIALIVGGLLIALIGISILLYLN